MFPVPGMQKQRELPETRPPEPQNDPPDAGKGVICLQPEGGPAGNADLQWAHQALSKALPSPVLQGALPAFGEGSPPVDGPLGQCLTAALDTIAGAAREKEAAVGQKLQSNDTAEENNEEATLPSSKCLLGFRI